MASVNSTPTIAAGNKDLATMKNEQLINLDLCPKNKTDAAIEAGDCVKYLINGSPVKGEIPIHKIPRTAFIQLYKDAEAITGAGLYLTGLQMEFAVNFDNENQYCLVFTPVRLDNGKLLATGSNYYSYTKIEGAKSYLFDGTDFVPTTKRNDYTARYREKIQILHSDLANDAHCAFIQGYDVNSMVFSFQEIFSIMFDNRGPMPASNDIFTGYEKEPIIIFNCIRRDQLNPTLLIKHGLLLSPNMWILGQPFENAFGNLAHLCPPHCTNLVYYKF